MQQIGGLNAQLHQPRFFLVNAATIEIDDLDAVVTALDAVSPHLTQRSGRKSVTPFVVVDASGHLPFPRTEWGGIRLELCRRFDAVSDLLGSPRLDRERHRGGDYGCKLDLFGVERVRRIV